MRPAFFLCRRRWSVGVVLAALLASQSGCGRTPVRQPAPERTGHTGRETADASVAPDSARRQIGAGTINLQNVTGESGIRFRHTDGSSGQKYIPETVTAGLALFDYDNDGWIDIYFLNGAPLPPTAGTPPPGNALYRNVGGMRFEDVTEQAGVGDTGFGLGVVVGDYDGDGYADIYVSNFGPNVLYRNHGDGTFSEVTQAAGVSRGDTCGAGTCFLDADKDGDLDLYVANYVDFRFETHHIRTVDGYPAYPSPLEFHPVPDLLYENSGDGTFADASRESGIGKVAGNGMGAVCADIENDGDTDIFVVNDVGENFLFLNDGSGRFEEEGLVRGLACNSEGHAQGSMGVDCADYDQDGQLDFFMTSYSAEWPVLYRNVGQGCFEDVTLRAGAGAGSFAHVKWGTAFADFDNDGDKDIYLACGHLQDNIEKWDPSTAYCVRNVLLMNTGDGKFVDVSDISGDGMLPKLSSRGIGVDDLDNDGDVDVVVLNARDGPTVLRNEPRVSQHWIEIQLVGTATNRDGVGAHVRVTTGDTVQLDEVHSGRGYQSHHGMLLHFGLGNHDRVDRVEVRWIGGGVQEIRGVKADQRLTIIESR